jgi:hypothetical protein
MEADLCMKAVLAEDQPSINRIRPAFGFASPSPAVFTPRAAVKDSDRGDSQHDPSHAAYRGHVFEKPLTHQSGMQDEVTILIVSANLESRRTVNKILEQLSTQIISFSTVSQTEQVLSLQRPNLIFCEERLPDGSYIDLLPGKHSGRIPPPVVVLTRTGEWDLYMDAPGSV